MILPVMTAPRETRTVSYRVGDRDAGSRLDRFLKERIPRMSRERIKEAIRTRVRVLGRPGAGPATLLRPGDEVVVDYPGPPAGVPLAGAVPEVPILHVDEDLLVVDKPGNLLVHATTSSRAPALLDALEASGHEGLHLVHRLDRETSGVVVLARSGRAAQALSSQFASGAVEKVYLAVVFGVVGRGEEVIDLPLGREGRSAVHIKQGVDRRAGRRAVTAFRVIDRFGGFSLLEVRPRTGRRHQIRVHLGAIGHPVVGDKLYGARETHHLRYPVVGFDDRMRRDLITERHLLHASAIRLEHPCDGRPVLFRAPLPPDMAGFIASRGGRAC